MSETNTHIRQLLRELELNFSVFDGQESASVPYWSADGRDKIDAQITVHDQGTFVQFSTLFGRMEEGTPAYQRVMQLLNQANGRFRLIKFFCMDDGTIRATGDLPMADSQFTPMLFKNTFDCFTSLALRVAAQIRQVFETLPSTAANRSHEMAPALQGE